ncbi:MAG: FkbM family methyltransferase [Agriterribacter sp.]|jgi:FkbM family methyltransferase
MKSFFDIHSIKHFSRAEFEQACFNNADHVYIGNNTVLCTVLGRYKMYVDSTDLGISPHLMLSGFWESWLSLLFAQIIQPGSVCLDVGANFGYYSVLMSELCGDKGKTIAVEANPKIAKLLQFTSFANGGRFEVMQSAISNKRGEAIMTITEHQLGGGTIQPNEIASGKSQIAVPTLTIDELVKEKGLPRVDIMKIDVEGVEPEVFEGMIETIDKNPQLQIIMEYSPAIYPDARKFTEFLFSNFIVYQATHVDHITELKFSDIQKLLSLKFHTDLYLKRK